MDAHGWRLALLAVVGISPFSFAANYRTANFLVSADTRELAREIGDAAEGYRSQLAIEWLGHELPPWTQPCPIRANVNPNLGAGGATSFVFNSVPRQSGRLPVGDQRAVPTAARQPVGWDMTLQGSRERVLDSVLPHEVTHTIFATHFGQPLPRWADEGACTTVEHQSERKKQEQLLYEFLTTGRGIAFNRMFAMTEYPQDILPLYSQGYSLARFLLQHGDRRKFVDYVGDGLATNDWTTATKKHYGFENLSELQLTWLDWVRAGSPKPGPSADATTLLAEAHPRRVLGQDQRPAEPMFAAAASPSRPLPAARTTSRSQQDSWYARRRDGREARMKQSTAAPEDAPRELRLEERPTPRVSRLHRGKLAPVPASARTSSRPVKEDPPRVRIEWGAPSPATR